MKNRRSRFLLALVSLALAAQPVLAAPRYMIKVPAVGCASGTQPVVPGGRGHVAATSPARINQLFTRFGEDPAAQKERNALARQLDELNRQLVELKTFMFVMLARNEARGVDIEPLGVVRGPLRPAVPTATQLAALAGRMLLGLAPGETSVDDVPWPRQIAAAEGVPAPASEPARKAALPEGPVSGSTPLRQVVKTEQWIAKGGSTLRGELLLWAESAGRRVIYDTTTDYQLIHDVPMPGRFDEAGAALLRLYEVAEQPLFTDISVSQQLGYITNRQSK